MPRPDRYYSLTRPKLRQSWNKYNLYNLYKQAGKEPNIGWPRTFFQQKWAAKSKTRGYHGEHIPEKKWKRLFSRRLMSAVDMSPEYLAAHDGSEQAAGRGSGLSTTKVTAETYSRVANLQQTNSLVASSGQGRLDANKRVQEPVKRMTPYMHMTYAPLERRLDTAVFRALFASSIRQARQFVVHGGVKVNGKKMVHPAYQLNPGDMFQVEIEKVLYGTGKQKAQTAKSLQESLAAREKRVARLLQTASAKKAGGEVAEAAADEEVAPAEDENVQEGETAQEGENAQKNESAEEGGNAEAGETAAEGAELSEAEAWKLNNRKLKFLLKDVKGVLKVDTKELSANDKKRLRLFRTTAQRLMSQGEKANMSVKELMADLHLQMKSHEVMRKSFEKFSFSDPKAATEAGEGEGEGEEEKPKYNKGAQIAKSFQQLTEEQRERATRIMGDSQLSTDEMKNLARLLRYDDENPMDDSKPYATPWQPRPYMGAFAFIPRYLEVNPNICAAVYLRHPVARKGLAEVPTPFSYLTSQLSHNWYLRRG